MKEKKIYRIWDKKKEEYITRYGYSTKSTWNVFPKEAIKVSASWDKEWKKFDENFEVHEFELKLSKKLNSNKELLK